MDTKEIQISQDLFLNLLNKLLDAIKEKINLDDETIAKYKEKLETLLKILSKFMNMEEIKETVNNIVAKIKDAVIEVINDFLDGVPVLKTLIKFIMECFEDGSINNIKLLLKKLFKIALNEFKKKVEEILAAVKKAFEELKENAKNIFQEFINKLDKLWDKIKEFFEERIKDMSIYYVPANIEKNIRMMYSNTNPQMRFSEMTHARVAYNKLVKLLKETVGEDRLQAEMDKLQEKYRNNYVGQYIHAKKVYLKKEEN